MISIAGIAAIRMSLNLPCEICNGKLGGGNL
jgi:hypothetical protein